MLALLALLLLLNDGQNRRSNHGHGSWCGLDIEHVLQILRGVLAAIEKSGLAQQQVGLGEVVGRKGTNNSLDHSQARVDLSLVSVIEVVKTFMISAILMC